MVVEHRISPRRVRPVPTSSLARSNPALRLLALAHDVWLARRATAKWRRELQVLDSRILRDIGVNQLIIAEICDAAENRAAAAQQRKWREMRESTFPPHCEPDVAKVAPNIRG